MNEGHAAFLTLERAHELVAAGQTFDKAIAATRKGNIFTTHTPVPPVTTNSRSGWWIKTCRITGPSWVSP